MKRSVPELLKTSIHYEKCAVCGKPINFTQGLSRAGYQWMLSKKGKTKYYCGYSHYQAGRIRGDADE